MKVIKLDWCHNVILPDITMKNTSGKPLDHVSCPYLFYNRPKPILGPIDPELYDGKYNYCTLINQKFRVYRGYGDMKKMFADCPLEDISNVDKLVAQLEAQLEEMGAQLKQLENLSGNTVHVARPEDQLKVLLKQVKEHC